MAKANPRESRLRHEQQRDRKMHYRLLSLVVSVAGLLVSGACLGNDTLESVRRRLIPKPQQLQIGAGEFTWNKEIPLIVEPGNARDARINVLEHRRLVADHDLDRPLVLRALAE